MTWAVWLACYCQTKARNLGPSKKAKTWRSARHKTTAPCQTDVFWEAARWPWAPCPVSTPLEFTSHLFLDVNITTPPTPTQANLAHLQHSSRFLTKNTSMAQDRQYIEQEWANRWREPKQGMSKKQLIISCHWCCIDLVGRGKHTRFWQTSEDWRLYLWSPSLDEPWFRLGSCFFF